MDPLAENLIPKINGILKPRRILLMLVVLIALLSKLFFLEKPPRGGKRQKRSSISAIINKGIRDGVIEKKQKRKRDIKLQQKCVLDRRLRFALK